MQTLLLGIGMLFFILCIINTSISLAFDVHEQNISNLRLKQLKNMKAKEDIEFREFMDALARKSDSTIMPRLKRLFPSIGKVDMVQLKRDLILADWDDTFTPESFISCVWALRVVGIIMFPFGLIAVGKMKVVILILSVVCIFGLEYWMTSTVKSIKEELFAEFPDFIRIVSGYLSADIPLVQSISDSIRYVGDAWDPILKTFVIDCENKSIDFALERMRDTVDLFEVKEFISLIRLTLEQGGNAKEGFLAQADKIEELQKSQLIIKVGKRKMMGTVAQAPLLLLNMVIIAVPTVVQALGMFGDGGMGGGF